MLERLDKRPYFFAAVAALFAIAVLGALALFFAMGTEAGARPGKMETPRYEILRTHDATMTRAVVVETPAKGEAGMRLIAEEIRDENTPKDGVLLVEYQEEKPPADSTGFALVFDDEEAVLGAGDSDRFGEVYDEEEAGRIMDEEDGVRVVSFRAFAEENPSLWEKATSFLR